MIAQISFKDPIVVTREEAEDLRLEYEEVTKVGIKNDRLEKMGSLDYYYDEVVNIDGEYYIDIDGERKELGSWYLYHRPKETKDWVALKQHYQLVDIEEFAMKCRYPFYIEKVVRTIDTNTRSINAILDRLDNKMKEIDIITEKTRVNTFNERLNVHIGGGLLVTYNELMLVEDECTDSLQQHLNKGWRIIAVCVQPDQRRPDYILGRYNPELELTNKNRATR